MALPSCSCCGELQTSGQHMSRCCVRVCRKEGGHTFSGLGSVFRSHIQVRIPPATSAIMPYDATRSTNPCDGKARSRARHGGTGNKEGHPLARNIPRSPLPHQADAVRQQCQHPHRKGDAQQHRDGRPGRPAALLLASGWSSDGASGDCDGSSCLPVSITALPQTSVESMYQIPAVPA